MITACNLLIYTKKWDVAHHGDCTTSDGTNTTDAYNVVGRIYIFSVTKKPLILTTKKLKDIYGGRLREEQKYLHHRNSIVILNI